MLLWPQSLSWLRWQTSASSCRKRSGTHRSSAWPKSLGLIRLRTEARPIAFASATELACLRLVTQGRVHREVRRFPTTTRGLLELAAWLEAARCTIVAMEATGVSWKPVWHILDGSFELVLANAAHIKGVPGRKSDVNDATWIADLLAPGLIRASFVPPQPIQDLRDLTRTRKQLSREIVPYAAPPGGAGGGERQAGLGDHGHPGRQRAAHPQGD